MDNLDQEHTGARVRRVEDRLARQLREVRLSVTDRCNFRCAYCMPQGPVYNFLPKSKLLTFEELEVLAKALAAIGVRKIRLTGGEPLLRKDLPKLIDLLKNVAGIRDVALTTNGLLLAKRAADLRAAGLDRLTVSLDSLDPQVFRELAGRDVAPEMVLRAIDAALSAGFPMVKLNCVVQRGVNEDSVLPLAARFRGTPHVVRFIEFMDVGTVNEWSMDVVVTAQEILGLIHEHYPLEPIAPRYHGEVASRYRYKDGSGEIGVIASVTKPFCRGCTRARVTPEGKLVTCLFATGSVDLRASIRSTMDPEGVAAFIAETWRQRDDHYSEQRFGLRSARPASKLEMFHLGG